MEANQQVFRHSPGKLVWAFTILLVFGFLSFLGKIDYFLLVVLGIGLVVLALYATSSIRISDQEISTHRLLGSKSLGWHEIERVSMRGQSLRLHNRDGNVTLSLDSQVEGYSEILGIIFEKRPALFDLGENDVLSRGMGSLGQVVFGLLLIIISVLGITFQGSEWFFGVLLGGLGGYLILSWFLSPQSIAFENDSILIMYLSKEIAYHANEIERVTLEKRRTRNGYVYFVQMNLQSGKRIKLPIFMQGAIITYQILQRWHQKAIANSQNSFLAQTSPVDEIFPR